MTFSLTLLSKYFEQSGYPVQITIDLNNKQEPYLGFLVGSDMNGSLHVFLSFQDISDILDANNILEKLKIVRQDAKENKTYSTLEKRSDDLMYDTIRRYVYQLHKASTGKTIFPELIPLKKHRSDFSL